MPKGLDSFFFWNSGAEAVEQSIKIARQVTRRQNIIVMQGMSLVLSYGSVVRHAVLGKGPTTDARTGPWP
jgi:glutamate-1-semialdehyde aminotransferase